MNIQWQVTPRAPIWAGGAAVQDERTGSFVRTAPPGRKKDRAKAVFQNSRGVVRYASLIAVNWRRR